MTEDELRLAKLRLDKASPGPWKASNASTRKDPVVWMPDGEDSTILTKENAEFIAHARMDVERLLEYVVTSQAQYAALHEDLARAEYAAAIAQEETERWKGIAHNEAAASMKVLRPRGRLPEDE